MEDVAHKQPSACIELKVGCWLPEYNQDATRTPTEKVLTPEEKLMVEAHLVRCSFCREHLSEESRLSFETTLILSGFFLDELVLLEQRRGKLRRLIDGQLTEQDYQEMARGTWLEIPEEEYRELKRFMGRAE